MEDMRADKGAYDDDKVVSSVADHLRALRGDGEDKAPPKPPADDAGDDLENDDTSTPDDDNQADDDADDQSDDTDDDAGAGADAESSIADNVYRSLIHNGWKPEEISDFYKADPARANKVFEKIHDDVNNLSRQFAQIGRSKAEMERSQQQNASAAQTGAKPVEDFIDIAALRKADPDNELLPIVEGLNKALKQLAPQQAAAPASEPANSGNQRDLALATQIISFLGSDHLETYSDFYGPAYDENKMPTFDSTQLTPGQAANRRALLDTADDIWIGAKMHGRELTVAEALQMAHSLMTDKMRTQKVREELVGKIKKRSKGMTLRPTRKGSPQPKEGAKPANEKEFETRTAARLQKLRGKL